MKTDSVQIHDAGYNRDLDFFKEYNKNHQKQDFWKQYMFIETTKYDKLINQFNNDKKLAVDIGCGPGWFCEKFSTIFENIIGIDPSPIIINICKELYKDKNNIMWVNGFAEDELSIILNDKDYPIFLNTCSVFIHLDNDIVTNILNVINNKSKIGSIISLEEFWGMDTDLPLHKVRNINWWCERLSNWQLDFHGPVVLPNTNKGIHGIKIR